ncbi:DUF6197 family protein [Streptomyces nigrescens]|uniref:Uncharacterized protein n=1 Tax=Streptomyces nigrescens TaxID=1920 RepID=A0A640T8I6_STRNI|nr:hypothetical protein [Streptomyces libani]WAT94905.1 hypothetical protein STRLI_000577 [Streptomyces libani subsp. libani]GFE20053.1 hypothetical protein Sliba_05060 [Streptomyces libani subsp. libani]GGV85684.1 hypothetical protein GCM10010500_02590 [Streptomyces libani subsp. libani]
MPTLTAAALDQAAARTIRTDRLTEPERTARALSFDERLVLAVLAVDARMNTEPLDLADVIHGPVDAPTAPAVQPQPYRTPIAALLHRAHTRLLRDGWCANRLRGEQGDRCLIGAIRAEASSRGEADDACTLLLDIVRDEFDPTAETIASWNDRQRDGHMPARLLGHAASRADARGI